MTAKTQIVYLFTIIKKNMTDYQKQADDFAKKHGVTLHFIGEPVKRKYFPKDETARYVFRCRLRSGGGTYTFDFGQSIAAGNKKPTMYDILACMTKYDPGSFENFCGEYGYDEDSRSEEKTYKAVCKEWDAVNRMFSSEALEEMSEIA